MLTSLMGQEPIAGSEITLRFEKEVLAGYAGCNWYGGGPDSGEYSAKSDGSLAIGTLAVTVRLCFEPDGIMEQEVAYVSALEAGVSWSVTDGRLEIANASGETTLVFARLLSSSGVPQSS
jgi:heat shock protein HslJ